MEYKNDRLVMYLHGGSGNHGCEAIVNSTCHMTEGIPKLLVTNSEQEDRRYSVGALCDILQERKIAEHFFAHVWYYVWRKVFHDPESFMRYRFRRVLGKELAPLYLSIGGDMYCYEVPRKKPCWPIVLLPGGSQNGSVGLFSGTGVVRGSGSGGRHEALYLDYAPGVHYGTGIERCRGSGECEKVSGPGLFPGPGIVCITGQASGRERPSV